MDNSFDNLLEPFKIGSVEIKNRFCMGPMGMPFLVGKDCEISDLGIEYYEERAKGGFGLIFSGVMGTDMEVDPLTPESSCPRFAPPDFIRSAKTLNERLDAYGAKMFPQLTMGVGRNAPGFHTPSELPLFWAPSVKTKALTNEEIKKKIDYVVESAAICKNGGFSGVEIHAMHWGYLLDEFAMALMNKRTDEYGGSLENRLRAAKEIVQGIKQVCGSDFAVTMRLGLKSYIKGFNKPSLFGEEEAGRTLEEGVRIAECLESYGYDALSVDAGIYDSFYHAIPPMYMEKGHVINLAAEVKKTVKIPLLVGSKMNDPFMCEEALEEGKIDAVVMSRQSIADPYFPQKVEMGVPEKIRPCISCNQGCFGKLFSRQTPICAVNPTSSKDPNSDITKALQKKKVIVVGGGVAGMEFARTSALRGHQVSLYEKSDGLGGKLIPGGTHDFKRDMADLNQWYQREIKELGVDIHLGNEISVKDIKELGPDVVALSVGCSSVIPKLPGIDKAIVSSSIDALLGKKEIGHNVVVVGGGLVGCELAYDYAMEGKNVTIVEALDAILSSCDPVPIPNRTMLNDLLVHYDVKTMTGYRLEAVEDDGVKVVPSNGDGEEKKVLADSVIISIGFKPLSSMAKELKKCGIEVYEVGDGRKVGNVATAVGSAFTVAKSV